MDHDRMANPDARGYQRVLYSIVKMLEDAKPTWHRNLALEHLVGIWSNTTWKQSYECVNRLNRRLLILGSHMFNTRVQNLFLRIGVA
jgi:hypothetical protein